MFQLVSKMEQEGKHLGMGGAGGNNMVGGEMCMRERERERERERGGEREKRVRNRVSKKNSFMSRVFTSVLHWNKFQRRRIIYI